MPTASNLSLKSCPRCRGTTHKTRDHYGEYVNCLRCGWYVDLRHDEGISIDELKAASPPHPRATSYTRRTG